MLVVYAVLVVRIHNLRVGVLRAPRNRCVRAPVGRTASVKNPFPARFLLTHRGRIFLVEYLWGDFKRPRSLFLFERDWERGCTGAGGCGGES